MQVNLARSAGFCSGVKRALKIARETARNAAPVFMLGDIVHNEDVLREMAELGVRKIRRLSNGKGKTLLVCAHGVPTRTLAKARALEYRVVDATCPMVREIHHTVADMEKRGLRVVVIGDPHHDEVRGIVGRLKRKAVVIGNADNLPVAALRRAGAIGVVAQSTQNVDVVRGVVGKLRDLVESVEFSNTICRPTRIKQREIMSMPLENDVMVIIGSSTSANTRRLYELSKAINERSYRVQSRDEIDPSWFAGAESVGVGAGASTPDSITNAVVEYLESLDG